MLPTMLSMMLPRETLAYAICPGVHLSSAFSSQLLQVVTLSWWHHLGLLVVVVTFDIRLVLEDYCEFGKPERLPVTRGECIIVVRAGAHFCDWIFGKRLLTSDIGARLDARTGAKLKATCSSRLSELHGGFFQRSTSRFVACGWWMDSLL